MPSRNTYAIPVDVLRRVDSSIEQSDIGNDVSFPVSEDTVRAHIEGVENEFERRAIELTDQSKEEELHEGIERDWGWTVYLDEENIESFDTSAGDKVEIRTGTDSWTDVADEAFVDTDMGVIEVDRRFVRNAPWEWIEDTNYNFRVTYRYGSTGDDSGTTSLAQSIADTDTAPLTVSVNDAEEIAEGSIVLVDSDEYMFVSSTDTTNDTVEVTERALRGTTATSHSSGDGVNFIPLQVRDGVSAKVASRLLRQDDFLDVLNEGAGDSIDTQQKVEDLDEEFEAVISQYSTSSGYI